MRKQNGISLLSLAITIMVIPILASVSLVWITDESKDATRKAQVTAIAVELKEIQQKVETQIANLTYERANIDEYQTLASLGISGGQYSSYIAIREGIMYIIQDADEKLKEAAQMAQIDILYE